MGAEFHGERTGPFSGAKFSRGCKEDGSLEWLEVDDERGHFRLTGEELVRLWKISRSAAIYQQYLNIRADHPVSESELAGAMAFVERLSARAFALVVAREHQYSMWQEVRATGHALVSGLPMEGAYLDLQELYIKIVRISEKIRGNAELTPEVPGIAMQQNSTLDLMIIEILEGLGDHMIRLTPAHQQEELVDLLSRLDRDARASVRHESGLPPRDIVIKPTPVNVQSIDLISGHLPDPSPPGPERSDAFGHFVSINNEES
jgi:hypothetical protein